MNSEGEVAKTLYKINGYNEFNQLTSSYEGSKENPVDNEKLHYEYNEKDEISKVIYPITNTIKEVIYDYDTRGKVIDIKAKVGANTNVVREYAYKDNGNILSIKDYTGFNAGTNAYTLREYTYDNLDRVTKISYKNSSNLDKITEKYEYSYNKNSDITKEKLYNNYTEDTKTDKTKDYTYDNLGRLTSVKVTNNLTQNESNTSYTYDKIGNRLSKTKGSMEEKYSYNDLNELENIKNASDTIIKSYTYDANGNTTKETAGNEVIDYKYDIDNQMTSYTKTVGENETLRQTNEYNSDGQRITKTVEQGETSNITKYNYDRGNLLYTTNGSGNLTSENILNLEGNVISSARAENDNTKFYAYNKDTRGSTTNVIDENGNSKVSYEYDEFGVTTPSSNTFYNEICYTGGIYDKETGEYYLNARYYNPEDGRFVTADTYRGNFDEPDTLHLYAYCANNPINYIDPSGHLPVCVSMYIYSYTGARNNNNINLSSWGMGKAMKKKLKKSKVLTYRLKKFKKHVTKNKWYTRKKPIYFKSVDRDLNLSIGHADDFVTKMKHLYGKVYKIKVHISDKYNFDKFTTEDHSRIITFLNNAAGYIPERRGAVKEYKWKGNFEFNKTLK